MTHDSLHTQEYTAAMHLELDLHLADGYTSPSQRARVLTEGWFAENMYCPACPSPRLARTRGSTQVVDFLCDSCGAEYQVKAKAGSLGSRLRDAAYRPMIERARENRSPHFVFLGYDSESWRVRGLLLVPGHFITPDVIQRCKPLSPSARRAGWIGCNILAGQIPSDGRLAAVEDGCIVPVQKVRAGWQRFADLAKAKADQRGWTVDVLRCVRAQGTGEFTLTAFYECFEKELASRHPDNKNVQPKMRQQLQVLRDRGVVRFLGRGRYVVE
jgi:type II restriction enzyme